MKIKPIIIVSGEPYSVFLEIFFKTLSNKKIRNFKNPILIIASYDLLLKQMKKLKYSFKIKLVDDKFFNLNKLNNRKINLINVNFNQKKVFDKISSSSNYYIAQCFNVGLKLMKESKGCALINGPISKKHFLKKRFPGITEYLASKTGHAGNEVMLIYNNNLSVSPITTHLTLKSIFKKIKIKEITKQVITINKFYKKFLNKIPKIAITGLNPHCESIKDKTLKKYILENYLEKIRSLTPLQKFSKSRKIKNYRILSETKKISVAKDHLSKEEIKEYSILYIMYNYPKIITPRIEIFKEIKLSSDSLNKLKSDLLNLISENKLDEKNVSAFKEKYSSLIDNINQNAVIKNIFLKKDEDQQIEMLNEILKELNEIKFSKKIDNLEKKLIKEFDEKSYSDLLELKSQINKE